MITKKSNARVTLALDIIRKIDGGSDSGYHELQAVKHEIGLHDLITVNESREMRIITEHPSLPRDEKNLCWQTAELVKKEFGLTKSVEITIDKRIPIAGGLAGGSSNAATTISLLDRLWGLNMPLEQKITLGRKIGRDIPYFFIGGTVVDDEISIPDVIRTTVSLNFIVVIPEKGIPTKYAYEDIDYSKIGKQKSKTKALMKGIESENLSVIKANLHNDFEQFVFPKYPQLKEIKEKLESLGCPAVLSGSGSTMIGICPEGKEKRIQDSLPWNSFVVNSQ